MAALSFPSETFYEPFTQKKAGVKTICDHIVRYDSGYAFMGDEDEKDGRPELLTRSGEVISYDIVFTFCPKCGEKLEARE